MVETDRKSREFWCMSELSVSRETGYECPPNDGVWWVPALGFSMTEGLSLFETREEAVKAAIKKGTEQIAGIRSALNRLATEERNDA